MFVIQNFLKSSGFNLMTQTTDSADDRYHSHSFFEVFYVTSGSILHEVNGIKTMLSTGDICFLRPGDSHIFHREKNNTSVHRDILISGTLLEKACNFLSPNFYRIFTSSAQPFTFRLPQEDLYFLDEKLTTFSNLQAVSLGIDLSSHENYLAVLILNMLLNKLENHQTYKYPQWIQDLVGKLNDNANFTYTLTEIIDEIPYNKSYISRVFTKHVGMTVSQYFISSRVLYSIKLLKFTQMPISNIATASGFSTITYYNRVFKKQFGVTPSEYRRSALSVQTLTKAKKGTPPEK